MKRAKNFGTVPITFSLLSVSLSKAYSFFSKHTWDTPSVLNCQVVGTEVSASNSPTWNQDFKFKKFYEGAACVLGPSEQSHRLTNHKSIWNMGYLGGWVLHWDTWALCWGKRAPLVAAHGLLYRCASWALKCMGSAVVAHGGLAAPQQVGS